MPKREKFIDGATVSFDDEPTEVRARQPALEDAETVAQEIPAKLVRATLPVAEDPDDPHLRDTVAEPPDPAEASGEVDTEPPDEDGQDRDVDLSVRLAHGLDMDSVVETVTEVVARPNDDLVIVFRDESAGAGDSIDEEFDGRETLEREPPAPVAKETVIGKGRSAARGKKLPVGKPPLNVRRSMPAEPGKDSGGNSQTRAGHARARTTRGESQSDAVASEVALPVSGAGADRATQNRTTQRRTRKEPKPADRAGTDDDVTKIRD